MSGHSKWSTIKHQKGAKDARRGKLFAKLIRAIEIAAREGGSSPEGNPTLADAICDRLLHNAHRIVLQGPSRRKEAKLDS